MKSFSLVVENEFRKKKDLNLGVQLPFLVKICIHTAVVPQLDDNCPKLDLKMQLKRSDFLLRYDVSN